MKFAATRRNSDGSATVTTVTLLSGKYHVNRTTHRHGGTEEAFLGAFTLHQQVRKVAPELFTPDVESDGLYD